MKNLSFLISIFALTVLYSCNNNIKSETQSVVEKPLIDNPLSTNDTSISNQTNVETTQKENNADTLNKKIKYLIKDNEEGKEAPKHISPDQSEIDSLKKAKQKLKK